MSAERNMSDVSTVEAGATDGEMPADSDGHKEAEWLRMVREDPNGLASLIAGQRLELYGRVAAERERVAYLNRVDQAVRADLGRGNLSSSSMDALRAAKLPLTHLNAVIQSEIAAGRWSLRAGNRNLTASPELARAFSEAALKWQKVVAVANDSLEKLVRHAQTAFDDYEDDARHMRPGADSYLAPFTFPQQSYVGDQLASDAQYSYKRRPFPRWLMQVNVVPDRPWAVLPRIDLCDKNLVFMPDDESVTYEQATLAVQGIVADQMSRAAPNCLRVTWIDALHNGQSAGPFLGLTHDDPLIIDGQIWADPNGIESALLRVVNRMADLESSCLKNEFEDLDAYNAQAGTSREANQVLVVAGYPHGFRESSARLLKQISANSRRVGISVVIIMDSGMASIVQTVDSVAPSYADLVDGPGPSSPPEWWSFDVLPLGEFVLGHSGRPYTRIDTLPKPGSAWVPCDLRYMDKGVQSAIINGYARASRQLAESGLSPRELEKERLDPAARVVALRNAMMSWLHDQVAGNHRPADWNGFAHASTAYVRGTPYTPDELAKQASYLYDQGYIVAGVDSRDSKGLSHPRLTPKGEDMVIKGGSSIDDFAANSGTGGATTINNAPVFHGDASGNQLAWNNNDVRQSQHNSTHVAPELSDLARVVEEVLAQLPRFSLPAEDSEDAAASANEILTEVASSSPDRGRIRRALAALKGFLLPVANQAAAGAAEGAHDLAKEALDQLQNVVF